MGIRQERKELVISVNRGRGRKKHLVHVTAESPSLAVHLSLPLELSMTAILGEIEDMWEYEYKNRGSW